MSIVTVIGMHRSGTSLLCKLLDSCGVKFPGDLLVASDNPDGHFENKNLLSFHKELLISRGLDKDGLELKQAPSNFSTDEKKTAKETFEKEFDKNGHGYFGWKDPRNTLFVDNWNEILSDHFFICIFRNYWEVADSLVRRDYQAMVYPTRNFLKRIKWFLYWKITERSNFKKYLNQWIIYNEVVISFMSVNAKNRILISSNNLKNNPEEVINRINARFEIQLKTDFHNPVRRDYMRESSIDDIPNWKKNAWATSILERLSFIESRS